MEVEPGLAAVAVPASLQDLRFVFGHPETFDLKASIVARTETGPPPGRDSRVHAVCVPAGR